MSRSTLSRLFALGFMMAALGASPRALAQTTAQAAVSPAWLDVGKQPSGREIERTVRLINTSDSTIRLARVVVRGDGVTVDAPLRRLAPQAIMQIPLRIRVPEPDVVRRTSVDFILGGGERVTLEVLVLSVFDDGTWDSVVPERPRGAILYFEPGPLYLQDVEAGMTVDSGAWLINESIDAVRVQEVKPRCGCVSAQIRHEAIGPGEATWLGLQAQGPGTPNEKATSVLLVLEGGGLIELPMVITSIHRYEKRVKEFHDYRDREALDEARTLVSPDCMVFKEDWESEGEQLSFDADGPWTSWNRELDVQRLYGGYQVNDRRVSVIVVERNDFHRILERDAIRLRVTYEFDDDDRISRMLVERIRPETPSEGHFAEFIAWADRYAPIELRRVYRDGQLVPPSAESGRQWRSLLVRWRERVGG